MVGGAAAAQPLAQLEIFVHDELVGQYAGEFKQLESVSSMFCPMVRNKIEHYKKTARKLLFLAEKIRNSSQPSEADLQELKGLKQRQIQDKAFLESSAPALEVSWRLGKEGAFLPEAIRSRQFEFDLVSWVLETSEEFGYDLPQGTLIQVDPTGGSVSITFKSKVADFCLSAPYAKLKLNIKR
jgi:hypothetical protein